MKKSLLALATMGAFAGAAQAQSSVSVYGVMDGAYSSIEQNTTDTTGAKSTVKSRNTVNGDGALSTSRLGFRGVEDLGGGLSAQFVLEYDLVNIGTGGNGNYGDQAAAGVDTNNVASGFGPRYSYIGLSSKSMGTLRLGRQESPSHGAVAANLAGGANNVLGSLYSGVDAGVLSATQTPSVRPHNVFINNAVGFISNNIGGATFQLMTAQNAYSATVAAPSAGSQYTGGSVSFTGIKNLRADASYGVGATTSTGLANSNVKRVTTTLGGNYNFGIAQLFVLHTQNKFENLNNPTQSATMAKDMSNTKLTEVGVKAPVSKVIDVWGNYFTGTRSTGSTSVTMVQSATAAAAAADIKGFQLGTTYAFSKRTTAYGIYGTQELKGVGAANGAKLEGSMYAVGLRHTF
jgi:predicted porin